MKRPFVLVAFALSLIAGACTQPQKQTHAEDVYEIPVEHVVTQEELVERGKYLVSSIGCSDCHTPKLFTEKGMELDETRLLSGHNQNDPLPKVDKNALTNGWVLFAGDLTAAVGPWGVSFAANLTPDDTGIGTWTFDNFKTAIQKGKYKGLEGSRDLLPPMPWEMYRNMSEDDLRAIFSYLKSLPKVQNLVPAPIAPPDIEYSTNTLAKK
jgi:hypothetical protein